MVVMLVGYSVGWTVLIPVVTTAASMAAQLAASMAETSVYSDVRMVVWSAADLAETTDASLVVCLVGCSAASMAVMTVEYSRSG